MKGLKKLLTGILAATLVMGMSTTAFATEAGTSTSGQGTVTVNNANSEETYTLYKIFDFQSSGEDSGIYTIDSGSAWYPFVSGNGEGAKYVNLTAVTGSTTKFYVSWKKENPVSTPDAEDAAKDTDVQAFAKAALKFASDNSIANQGQIKAQKTDDPVNEKTTVEFTGLSLGYYMVGSSAGALVSLDTTNKDATVNEKNDVPSIDKKEDEDSELPDIKFINDDQEIGKIVNYKTTVNMKAGGYNYIVNDKMSEGLTYNYDVKVSESTPLPEGISIQVWDGKNGTTPLKYKDTEEDSTFTVRFVSTGTDNLATFTEDVNIDLLYSATVNGATQVLVPEENKTYLKYNEENETGEKFTHTYVYKLEIIKKNGNGEKLPGAVFSVKNISDPGLTEENAPVLNVVLETLGDGTNASVYRLANGETPEALTAADVENETDNTKRPAKQEVNKAYGFIITPASGLVEIRGVDADTYYLTELVAPNGYNLLIDPVAIQVTRVSGSLINDVKCISSFKIDNKDVEVSRNEDGNITAVNIPESALREIINNSGAILPSTGGIGTTIFYIVGALLICAAVVFMIMKRKGVQAE